MKNSLILLFLLIIFSSNTPNLYINKDKIDKEINDKIWEALVNAICIIESNNNDNAINPRSGASGRFQMKTIYVDEVNRILKQNKYKYSDRFDAKKSREMFEIYQSHHNPTKDINKAMVIHRGKHSKKYINAVKKEMKCT
ncbi:MAG: hypothetical protein J6A25_05880 [Lachnospiraceae bacterium]|nr:hypothetical protein [Lachnospiraceae bacterium]